VADSFCYLNCQQLHAFGVALPLAPAWSGLLFVGERMLVGVVVVAAAAVGDGGVGWFGKTFAVDG